MDESHGVNRKFHKYDPIDAFPMLDSDLDLSDDAIGSRQSIREEDVSFVSGPNGSQAHQAVYEP